jgi:hypothetical protein
MAHPVKTVLAVVIAAAVGGGAWLYTKGGSASGGATMAPMERIKAAIPDAVVDKLSLGPDEDRPVRCRIGEEDRLMRGLDCRQQGGFVAGDGSDAGYSTVTPEEQRAAVAPTLSKRDPAPDAKK